MRLLLISLLLCLPTAALADARGFSGTLELRLGALTPVPVAGAGVATINSSAGGGVLSTLDLAGGITGSTTVPITDPMATSIVSLRATMSLGTGSLRPIAAVLSSSLLDLVPGTLPVLGQARICLLVPGCSTAITVPLTSNGSQGFGLGGTVTGSLGSLRVSVQGAPWTVKQATLLQRTSGGGITFPTAMGFAHGPLSFTSSVGSPSGVVQLVTPMQVTTAGFPGENDLIALFGVLRIDFAPEPQPVLLLASGALALAGLQRLRRRRSGRGHGAAVARSRARR